MFVAEVVLRCVRTGHRQTRQLVHADWKVFCQLQASASAATAEEGWTQQFITGELQAHLQPVDSLQDTGTACVDTQLIGSANFSVYQSAYRKGHFAETALLEVLDGVYTNADNKQVTVLISLDLSATFDTVDHEILLQRLQSEFGVTDTPLTWLRSYLEGRTQFVKLGQHQSPTVRLDVGVPQGSVLGPLLFAVYCSPVADVIASHGVRHPCSAPVSYQHHHRRCCRKRSAGRIEAQVAWRDH